MATIKVVRVFTFMKGRNVGIFEFEQVLCQRTLSVRLQDAQRGPLIDANSEKNF